MKFKLTLVLLWLLITTGEAIHCMSCDNVNDPMLCNRLTACNFHEICYVQLKLGLNLTPYYNFGCVDKNVCYANQSSTFPIGRRNMFDNHPSLIDSSDNVMSYSNDDMTLCTECCDRGDGCNRNLCALSSTSTARQTVTTMPTISLQINGPNKDHFLKATQLACVTNPVADSFTWKFNWTSSLPNGVTEQLISGQTGGPGIDIIHISNLTESTFGKYTCVATYSGHTVEQSHFIGILEEKPTVNIVKPPVASSFAIQCQVTGYPKPHIQWDFVPEATNNHGLPHDAQVLYENYKSTLFVNTYIPVDHTGRWYCKASNTAGSAVEEVHIP